jgi:uncharacterized protein with PIN domain
MSQENVEVEILVPYQRDGKRVMDWKMIRVDQIIMRTPRPTARCPECKSPARIHKANAKNAPQPHFEHVSNNPECSKSYTHENTKAQ